MSPSLPLSQMFDLATFCNSSEVPSGRIIGFREGEFSYRAIGTHEQWSSSIAMRVWKQWTEEHRTTPKTEGDVSARRSTRDPQDDE
ncbi:hypothetical protein TNCV_4925901 [Trichonephila clavipes]|nr:hypothetical protein TNCV_4925901 [Trichonephila clavipes]